MRKKKDVRLESALETANRPRNKGRRRKNSSESSLCDSCTHAWHKGYSPCREQPSWCRENWSRSVSRGISRPSSAEPGASSGSRGSSRSYSEDRGRQAERIRWTPESKTRTKAVTEGPVWKDGAGELYQQIINIPELRRKGPGRTGLSAEQLPRTRSQG